MDYSNLSMCTYNCCSLKKNIELIRGLTENNYDIIFLQETFITEDKLGILDFIDENYECAGVPAIFSERALAAMAGRPAGGLAILWKRNSLFMVKDIILKDYFILLSLYLINKLFL